MNEPVAVENNPNEVEPPPRTVSEVERSVYRDGWEQATPPEFEGYMKTGTFTIVDRIPEGRKPADSNWCFAYS